MMKCIGLSMYHLVVFTMFYAVVSDMGRADDAILLEEYIYRDAPFPECHASTIAETHDGLIAAWFGGTEERNPDVCIYVSRKDRGGTWTPPTRVADGIQQNGTQLPCWNPVLFNAGDKNLLLFYKVGPSPSTWWGMVKVSQDRGQTWSPSRRLPEGKLGPIRAKPVRLSNGRILCGSSDESDGWTVWMESCNDQAEDWQAVGPLNSKDEFGAIQPTILRYGDNRLQILCRSRQQVITECWSTDEGRIWSKMAKTSLPNPNAGIDAVSLVDGRQLLIYNHTTRNGPAPRGREMINLAVSTNGKDWLAALTLEKQPGEHSYPAMIQTSDGMVHITYTYHRETIKHVAIDPSKLRTTPIIDGKWPL